MALQGKDVNSRFTLYEKEDSRWKISIIVQNIFMLGKKYLCYTLHIQTKYEIVKIKQLCKKQLFA